MKNEPVFPLASTEYSDSNGFWAGLTKRELFAAMAMQGFLSNHPYLKQLDQKAAEAGVNLEFAAGRVAVSCADALITELEKNNE